MSSVRQAVIKLHSAMIRTGDWPCCLNCEEWSEVEVTTDEQKVYKWCGRYRVHPPNEVLVVGCQEHTPYIPF